MGGKNKGGEARVTEARHSRLTSAHTRRDMTVESHTNPPVHIPPNIPIQRRRALSTGVGTGSPTLAIPHSHPRMKALNIHNEKHMHTSLQTPQLDIPMQQKLGNARRKNTRVRLLSENWAMGRGGMEDGSLARSLTWPGEHSPGAPTPHTLLTLVRGLPRARSPSLTPSQEGAHQEGREANSSDQVATKPMVAPLHRRQTVQKGGFQPLKRIAYTRHEIQLKQGDPQRGTAEHQKTGPETLNTHQRGFFH